MEVQAAARLDGEMKVKGEYFEGAVAQALLGSSQVALYQHRYNEIRWERGNGSSNS